MGDTEITMTFSQLELDDIFGLLVDELATKKDEASRSLAEEHRFHLLLDKLHGNVSTGAQLYFDERFGGAK
ncbi:hypothetical protein [Terriglobus albidus]|uniref:hypothetical protein n=1 Tax=Terriglobus albidus TaxID=1592106 RepID=UPI0021E0F4B7|nr:hypothetical protein [Terriglobus albidus]